MPFPSFYIDIIQIFILAVLRRILLKLKFWRFHLIIFIIFRNEIFLKLLFFNLLLVFKLMDIDYFTLRFLYIPHLSMTPYFIGLCFYTHILFFFYLNHYKININRKRYRNLLHPLSFNSPMDSTLFFKFLMGCLWRPD